MNLNKSFEHVFIGKIQVESSLIGCMNCDQPSEHPKSRDRPGDVPLELPRLSTGRMSLGLSGSVPGTLQCYKIFMEIWKFLWYLENMLSKRIVQYIELTGFSGTFRKRSWDVTMLQDLLGDLKIYLELGKHAFKTNRSVYRTDGCLWDFPEAFLGR